MYKRQNVDRVQQIINSAEKFGRKVGVEGRSMVNIISTASELGYLKIPDNTLVEMCIRDRSLGKRILRTDTAAITVMSMLMLEIEMKEEE